MLIEDGRTNLNKVDSKGNTALMSALYYVHQDIIEILI